MHEDYIADMSFCESKSTLLAAGGDGIISVFDIRKPLEKIHTSEEFDDELLCVKVIQVKAEIRPKIEKLTSFLLE